MTGAPKGAIVLMAVSSALGCSIDSRILQVTVTDAQSSTVVDASGSTVTDAQSSSIVDALGLRDLFDSGDLLVPGVVDSGPVEGGPVACKGAPPATPIVIGTVDSPAGDAAMNSGYQFAAPGLTPPTVTFVTSPGGAPQTLQINADPGVSLDPSAGWGGLGFLFRSPSCVDASAFGGIQFTLTGDLGTCIVTFAALASNNTSFPGPGGLGACTASSCGGPVTGRLTTGTTVVRFADLSNGMPFPTLDSAALLGVAWNISVPTDTLSAPCKANFTISNVSFVALAGP